MLLKAHLNFKKGITKKTLAYRRNIFKKLLDCQRSIFTCLNLYLHFRIWENELDALKSESFIDNSKSCSASIGIFSLQVYYHYIY